MEIENSEKVSVDSSNRFLNKAFVKGFLAGIVIGCVSIPWLLISDVFSLDEVDGLPDWRYFVINCVLPFLLIYFTGKVVTFALGRYGFEGWTKDYMSLAQLFSAMFGLFTACVVFLILSVVWASIVVFES